MIATTQILARLLQCPHGERSRWILLVPDDLGVMRGEEAYCTVVEKTWQPLRTGYTREQAAEWVDREGATITELGKRLLFAAEVAR